MTMTRATAPTVALVSPARNQPAPTIQDPAAPDDLIVEFQSDIEFAKFSGTRAMLESEGLVPKDTEWPQGYDELHWRAGQIDCCLRRQRPPGAKGSRRAFAQVDWFYLRTQPADPQSWTSREIRLKSKELADAIYRQSAQGQAMLNAQWNRYNKATKDKRFQALKVTLGIVGRTRKNAITGQEAAA
jgi:hypothetical protein